MIKSTAISIAASAVAIASLGAAVHAVNVASVAAAPVAAPVAYSPLPSTATLNTVVAPAPAVEKWTPPAAVTAKSCKKMAPWLSKTIPACEGYRTTEKQFYRALRRMQQQAQPRPQSPAYSEPLINGVPAWVVQSNNEMRLRQLEQQQAQQRQSSYLNPVARTGSPSPIG